jgi:hypothetical protein
MRFNPSAVNCTSQRIPQCRSIFLEQFQLGSKPTIARSYSYTNIWPACINEFPKTRHHRGEVDCMSELPAHWRDTVYSLAKKFRVVKNDTPSAIHVKLVPNPEDLS